MKRDRKRSVKRDRKRSVKRDRKRSVKRRVQLRGGALPPPTVPSAPTEQELLRGYGYGYGYPGNNYNIAPPIPAEQVSMGPPIATARPLRYSIQDAIREGIINNNNCEAICRRLNGGINRTNETNNLHNNESNTRKRSIINKLMRNRMNSPTYQGHHRNYQDHHRAPRRWKRFFKNMGR